MVDQPERQLPVPDAEREPDIDAERQPNIYEMLAARARQASDGTLALLAAVGVLALGAASVLRPRWWGLALPLVAVGAYGAWGILDRAAATAGPLARALAAAKWAAAVIGTCAALMAALAFMAVVLGKFIS